MNASKNATLSLLALLIAGVIMALLILFKPKAERVEPPRPVTTIEAVTVSAETTQLTVLTQGNVQPRTRTRLAAEVGGLVTGLSPNFQEGRFFHEGEVLIRIDPADYRAAVAVQKAELAGARLALEEEKALAEQARIDWKRLGSGEASPLALRQPQLERAEARVESARAALAKAERDLERTSVKAPYDGRVEKKYVDLGQLVSPGNATPLADIFATDVAEVRLPVSDREAGYLDLPEMGRDLADTAGAPAVRLSGTLNGRETSWNAKLTRVEATIDPRSRLLYVVAEVEDGFAPAPPGGSAPLQPGLFVEAAISGREIDGVYVLPRYALRTGNRIYVVEPEKETPSAETNDTPAESGTVDGYLYSRQAEILQSTRESVVIASGLSEGDRVATSPIAYFVEGMPVQIKESE